MATGLKGLADRLTEACSKGGEFTPEPFYESKTDSLIYYVRDAPSASKRINRYLTVFLSREDSTLVGIEIKGVSVITTAVENLGAVTISQPVEINSGDGSLVDLSVFVRCSLVTGTDEPLGPEQYAELNHVSSGVKIPPSLCAVG